MEVIEVAGRRAGERLALRDEPEARDPSRVRNHLPATRHLTDDADVARARPACAIPIAGIAEGAEIAVLAGRAVRRLTVQAVLVHAVAAIDGVALTRGKPAN